MDIVSVQTPVLFGALVVACTALLQVHIGHRLAGSYIVPEPSTNSDRLDLALPDGLPAEVAVPQGKRATGDMPRAGRTPPMRKSPTDWAEQDTKVRRVVALSALPGPVYKGQVACACGGEWRYGLGSDAASLWRCLHCGGLHSGIDLVPEDDAPSE